MTGGDNKFRASLFRSVVRAGALEGSLYVVHDDSGKILSIGIWFGPGKMMFSTSVHWQVLRIIVN